MTNDRSSAALSTRPRGAPATAEPPLRIALVNTERPLHGEPIGAMNVIRFVRMAEALARRGHRVDLVVRGAAARLTSQAGVRQVGHEAVRWQDYDVVKTVLHSGFAALRAWGGHGHPFVVAELGSVVDRQTHEGVYFYGAVLDQLWQTQCRIASTARAVSVLTQASLELWRTAHGPAMPLVSVPGGVDREVPEPGANPYHALGIHDPVALFAGHLYLASRQGEVNALWQRRLNAMGRALRRRGVRLVAMGPGDTHLIDRTVVTHVGVVDFRRFWSWQWHAHVGLVLAQGPVQHNESSKIYYYLRTGLPVICEAPIPNASLVSHTGHGAVVPFEDDVTAMADAAARWADHSQDAGAVMSYMAEHHSWDARAALYADVLAGAVRPRIGRSR